jgi:hypothetical protein
MDVLNQVEKHVGPFDIWPTYILMYIFVDKPNDDTLKKVSAFLYGNGIDKEAAAEFFATCNPEGAPHRICDAVCHWYSTWEQHPRVKHLAMYYNVREGSLMWINGNEIDQDEVVEPKVSVVDLGVEGMKNINPESWSLLKCAIAELRGVEEEVFSGSDEEEDVDILDEETGEWRNVQESQEFM